MILAPEGRKRRLLRPSGAKIIIRRPWTHGWRRGLSSYVPPGLNHFCNRTPASVSAFSCSPLAWADSGLPSTNNRRYGANRFGPAASACTAFTSGVRSLILLLSSISSDNSVCLASGPRSSIWLSRRFSVDSLVTPASGDRSLIWFLASDSDDSRASPASGPRSVTLLSDRYSAIRFFSSPSPSGEAIWLWDSST